MEKNYEKEILEFWKKNKIYEKLRKKNEKGKKFYLMDGPPYATGHIHIGTALNKILKDIAMRSQSMQGKDVFDRPGYDTHGVPIEYKVETKLKFKTKKDIEKFGIRKFIEECKKFATQFIDVMNKEFENLGVWMNFKNPYLTLDKEYVETIWDVLKEASKKNLLYLGKYPVHVCPRCETAVSYNEIEYKKLKDNSIFVKFPLEQEKNTYLIIWTTTPWTLPANTAIMVNPNFEYSEIEVDGEKWIIAKELVEKLMKEIGKDYNEIKIYKGTDLEGKKYVNPLSKYLKLNLKNAYKVVLSARYVNLEEGTGLVHCAPGHGKEDFEVGNEYDLDMPSPVAMDGKLTEEAGKYAGEEAREVDEKIINDLEKDGFLVYRKEYAHDYPLCWRCKTPLIMISVPQWFLKISQIKENLLKYNEETNWIPSYMKLRMKAWLEGIGDWPISRKRYWGTPLPIWICKKCENRIVVGSIKELEKLSGKKIKDVHKPEIDEVTIKCKCGGTMKRVEEVMDVWFDSGVSSWAALNYLNDKEKFKKFWPADLNIEGKDQIRGWWNSQLILSEIKFGKKPYENIVVHGLVLDLGKRKMSKSLGNVITPQEIIEKYGVDMMRFYFAKISKGEDIAFDENEFKKISNFFRVLINVNNYINQLNQKKSKEKIEDKWIISRFNSFIEKALTEYNNFKFYNVVKEAEEFLINDLSKTYIQLTRERADETYSLLNKIRINFLKILSPIIPFITEKIWQELRKNKIVREESIHLSDFPDIEKSRINKDLEENFDHALKIIELGLAERDKAKIGLRWPLPKAIIKTNQSIPEEIKDIIARQLNIKKIEIKKASETLVELDTRLTPELEAEGYARELARKIQNSRKKANFVKEDVIEISILASNSLKNKLVRFEEFLKQRINARKIYLLDNEKNLKSGKGVEDSFSIKQEKIRIIFKKV